MLIWYSGWFLANLLYPRGEITSFGDESSFSSQWPLVFAAWAMLIAGLSGAVLMMAIPGAIRALAGKYKLPDLSNFTPSFMLGLFVLIGALHIKLCLVERVVVSGDSMSPGLVSGRTLWVEKLTTGFQMPVLSFPLGPIFKTGKLPRFGWRTPRRTAIVVIDYPGSGRKYLIKRVLGLPGDRFRFAKGRLIINGRVLREEYLAPGTRTLSIPENYQAPIRDFPPRLRFLDPLVRYSAMNGIGKKGVVPPHTLLVLGDNRARSRDSRSLGFVPLFFVTGVVMEP